jgi:hypothetical protein
MRHASEYRSQAMECCQLAHIAGSAEYRTVLMEMAAMWLSLAKRREKMDQAAATNAVSELITTNKVVALTDKVAALMRPKQAPGTGEADANVCGSQALISGG